VGEDKKIKMAIRFKTRFGNFKLVSFASFGSARHQKKDINRASSAVARVKRDYLKGRDFRGL